MIKISDNVSEAMSRKISLDKKGTIVNVWVSDDVIYSV